jgi:hypothetical protein
MCVKVSQNGRSNTLRAFKDWAISITVIAVVVPIVLSCVYTPPFPVLSHPVFRVFPAAVPTAMIYPADAQSSFNSNKTNTRPTKSVSDRIILTYH